MKIAVSNIAWDNGRLPEYLGFLRELGCEGVEIAPSCLWPEPVEATAGERQALRGLVRRADLELVGFHALLYTRPDLQLFQDARLRSLTVGYLVDLMRLCADVGGKLVVLGSPRNRRLNGNPLEQCLAWAADAFRQVAEQGERLGVAFCVEPLGPDDTDFLASMKEGGDLVRTIDHPYCRLHLDSKAIFGTGEDPFQIMQAYGDLIRHVHASDPGLAAPGAAGGEHRPIGAALRQHGYNGYVSIEMRREGNDDKAAVARAVNYVMETYLSRTQAMV